VAEADAEDGHASLHQVARVPDHVVEHGGIAGAVAEEHAVRRGLEQLARRRRGREHAHVAPVRREPPEDVPTSSRGRTRPREDGGGPSASAREVGRILRSSAQSNAALHVTWRTRSEPSICGATAAIPSIAGSTRPVPIVPRITPADRRTRVSSRVSISAMATMPALTR